MKKIVILLALCLALTGCGRTQKANVLTATVIEVHENSIVVLPMKSNSERTPADRIEVSTSSNPTLKLEMGDTVRIEHLGNLMESSPMQLSDVQSIALVWHDPQIATVPPTEPEILTLPQRLEMTFASGAGGWSTTLNINVDGSFSGNFHDSNMGEVGEDHPNGTVRYCNFQGRFQIISKPNDYTYTLTLAELRSDQPEGEQNIEGGTLYISATPYGLEGGKDFQLYAPEAPVSQLPQQFLNWWPGRTADPKPETLIQWGLHNLSADIGFFTAAAPES